MKNLLFLLLITPTLAMVSQTANISNISKAIEQGDAKTLAQYFDDKVDIAILDNEDTYDKANAEIIVKEFFVKNKPNAYAQVHKGVSKKENSQYSIGNLKASAGTFRVYLYMKVQGGKYIIQEMRIDEE